jgi:hypothetical protein
MKKDLLRHNRVRGLEFHRSEFAMPRVVKRSASQALKSSPSRRSRPNAPLPQFVPPSLPSPSRSLPRARNGSMRSSLTVSAWPLASITAACNF